MGRPKGSLNKKTIAAQSNPNKSSAVKASTGAYLFRASGCGCEDRRDIIGCGMFCKHKNSMLLGSK